LAENHQQRSFIVGILISRDFAATNSDFVNSAVAGQQSSNYVMEVKINDQEHIGP
jgi:hypothetical protein